jgi:hypothetical protein
MTQKSSRDMRKPHWKKPVKISCHRIIGKRGTCHFDLDIDFKHLNRVAQGTGDSREPQKAEQLLFNII